MDAYVEPHLNWRLLGPDDADELEHFRAQLDALDNSVLSALASSITSSDLSVGDGQAIGGWDAYNSLSAYGVNYVADHEQPRVYLLGGVHPVHRHLSIGTSLLRWQIGRAVEWRDEFRPGEPLWLGAYAELGRPGLERVAGRVGFTPERYYYDLHRDLTHPIRVPEIDGVTIQRFVPGNSEAVRRLHNLCFRPLGGAEVTEDVWRARLSDKDFRAEWSFLASVDDTVIGYAMSAVDEGGDDGSFAGWTERFGVHPEHRGRGISLALLGHCLAAMHGSGCAEAGIGIDTPDGLGLSRLGAELGYTTRDAVALLSKVVA